jgi:hypothetical protein
MINVSEDHALKMIRLRGELRQKHERIKELHKEMVKVEAEAFEITKQIVNHELPTR